MNRRSFLAASATTGLTIVRASQVRGSEANSKIEIGLIGCGEVCEHKHMPALREIDGARVTAVGDVNEGHARHVALRYDIEHVFADPQSLIRSGVANVIGVLVPPAAHLEVAAMAIDSIRPFRKTGLKRDQCFRPCKAVFLAMVTTLRYRYRYAGAGASAFRAAGDGR